MRLLDVLFFEFDLKDYTIDQCALNINRCGATTRLKHSNYLQLIQFNQLNSIQLMNSEKILLTSDIPLVNCALYIMMNSIQHLDTMFPIKFYGEYYKTVRILSNGIINIVESNFGKLSGSIKVFYGVWKTGQVDIIHNDKFLTVRWPNLNIYNAHGKEMKERAQITCTIHVNGNISIFFETIPNGTFNETEESMPGSTIYYPTKIQNNAYSPYYKNTAIKVPAFLIKSNTLMEFIPDPICSDQTSCGECLKPGAFATKCYWCPRTRRCTNTHDSYGRMWKKGECQIQNSKNCTVQNDVLTTPIRNIIGVAKSSIRRNKLTNLTQKITNNKLSEHVPNTTTVQNSKNCTVQNDVLTTPVQDIIGITKPSIRRNKLTNLTQKITNNKLSEHVPNTTTVQVIQVNKTLSIQLGNMFFILHHVIDSSYIILWMLATVFIIHFIILFNILCNLL
ncbi:unnamed protein product [Schistosoma mattheei]|uniref:PSI domain-containing protein n=1 Tax=Schistosoma mattheei TaxID=31246 RepID=A0AA85BFZ8_9TREM|nr:unnamed protein product [Schistosoma mattheei]